MTILELEGLLREHMPQNAVEQPRQGRASVTPFIRNYDFCGPCGRGFFLSRVDQVYCSPACKQKAYRARKAARR